MLGWIWQWCVYFLFLVALHERLVCSYALFCLIRVVPRYRKHISSFKISLRSIQWQGWSWMERLFAACTWGTLMKLKDCCLMHSTRQVLNSKCISYGWEFLNPGRDAVCFLLLGHNSQLLHITLWKACMSTSVRKENRKNLDDVEWWLFEFDPWWLWLISGLFF